MATRTATKINERRPPVTYSTKFQGALPQGHISDIRQDHGFGSLIVHSIGNAILRQAAQANDVLRNNMTANLSEFMRSGATLHRGGATLPQGGSLGALGRHGATLPSQHGRLYQTGINKKTRTVRENIW